MGMRPSQTRSPLARRLQAVVDEVSKELEVIKNFEGWQGQVFLDLIATIAPTKGKSGAAKGGRA
jgi:hypothetical protein